MTITPQLKQIYAAAPSGQTYIETIELAHSRFPQTFYLTNSPLLWTFSVPLAAGGSTLIDFNPVPFQVIQPTQDGQGQQDMQLVLDNVGRDAMDAIEAASAAPRENIRVVCRVYLKHPESFPQNDPPISLTLSQIDITKQSISGTATRSDTLNKLFPSYLYRTTNFPGLDR